MDDIDKLKKLLEKFDDEELAKLAEMIRAVGQDGCDLTRMMADFDAWLFEKRGSAAH